MEITTEHASDRTTLFGFRQATRTPAEYDGCFREARYTDDNTSMWRQLMADRTDFHRTHSHHTVTDGFRALNIREDRIPNLAEIDKRLFELTGWHVVQIDGTVTNDYLFGLAARKIRPINVMIRSTPKIPYTADFVHDLYHLFPLLDPHYAEFYRRAATAQFAAAKRGDTDIETQMYRLTWYLTEYGLVHENGRFKAIAPILHEEEGSYVMQNPQLIRLCSLEQIVQTPLPWELIQGYHPCSHHMPIQIAITSFKDLFEEFLRRMS